MVRPNRAALPAENCGEEKERRRDAWGKGDDSGTLVPPRGSGWQVDRRPLLTEPIGSAALQFSSNIFTNVV